MKRYLLTASAEADLAAIIEFYISEKHSPTAAKTVVRELKVAFRRLGRSPGIGHTRGDLSSKPFRFWPVRSYLIVYQPDRRPLRIVAILHGKRDVPSILDRR